MTTSKISIGSIDFGPRDARHAFITGDEPEKAFEETFIDPIGLNVEEFLNGKKSFIYGIKGAGKSAYLRHLDINARRHGFMTEFLYFTDHTEGTEADSRIGVGLPAKPAKDGGGYEQYWITVILLAIAKKVFEGNIPGSASYLKYLAKQQNAFYTGYLTSFLKRVPIFNTIIARFSPTGQSVEAEGVFREILTYEDFFEDAFIHLRSIGENKIAILIDELEVSFQTQSQFDQDIELARSLLRSIRSITERFRKDKIPIIVVAAIRKEAAAKISGGDAQKIVADLGQEISWDEAHRGYKNHPLFDIALGRIASSAGLRKGNGSLDLEKAQKEYLPFCGYSKEQRSILDLTTYRPRDISILFREAALVRKDATRFERIFFLKDCRRKYRNALWADFAEALRFSYAAGKVEVFGSVFNDQRNQFSFDDFRRTFDDYSADPNVAEMIDHFTWRDWAAILKELYELGAVGYLGENEKGLPIQAFYYRGQIDPLILKQGLRLVKTRGLETV